MRVAWLTPYLPAPENSGGRIRIAAMARAFAGEDVELYTRLAPDDGDPAVLLPPGGVHPWPRVHAARADGVWLPRLRVPEVALSFPRQLMDALGAAHARRPYDAVIAEHCYAMHGLPPLPGAALVLCEHNVESAYWRVRLSPRDPGTLRPWLAWRAFERRAWRRADAITAVTAADARAIGAYIGRPVTHIANGIDLSRYAYRPASARRTPGILFVGTLSYDPNIAAARTLALGVMPAVWREHPQAVATLAGRDPSAEVRALAGPRVKVTGTLAEMAPVFEEQAVYVSMLDLGAGSSLKILEPLASGIPLVASPFAVRGFPLEADVHYLRAETAAEAAAHVRAVLAAPQRYDAMVARAAELARRYDWADLGRRFRGVVEDAVAGGGVSGARARAAR